MPVEAVTEVAMKAGLALVRSTLAGQMFETISGKQIGGKPSEQQNPVEMQEIQLQLAESQAKVAQELAIAKRIEEAEQVEIEEYYEYAAEGQAGLKATEKTISAGLSGSGKRVSKRVYRFTGWCPTKPESLD